jgi:hypothetical protein
MIEVQEEEEVIVLGNGSHHKKFKPNPPIDCEDTDTVAPSVPIAASPQVPLIASKGGVNSNPKPMLGDFEDHEVRWMPFQMPGLN